MDVVSVNNLCFRYDDNVIFNDLNFTLKQNDFLTILGNGKSTLYKILTGSLDYDGKVLLLGKSITYSFEKGYVGTVSLSNKIFGKVIDILFLTLKNKGRTSERIKLDIKRAVKKTGINEILDYKYENLSFKDKILVMFTIQILAKPKLLIINNCLDYLDIEKDRIIREIIRLNKKCTVINISNNSEECVYGNYVLILGDKKYKTIHMVEKDFLKNNLSIPFMISLSSKLKFYKLIKKNYFDMERLIDDLWQ